MGLLGKPTILGNPHIWISFPPKKKNAAESQNPRPRWKIKLAESLLIFKTGKSTARLLSLIENTIVCNLQIVRWQLVVLLAGNFFDSE